MPNDSFFIFLTAILVIASILSIFLKYLRLPTILAYIFTGAILANFEIVEGVRFNAEILTDVSKIGVTFLLFLLGLELKIDELKSVGRVAVITGVGQIVFTSIIGFGLSLILGFSINAAIYLSVGLTFSSTIIIVKLLSDKRELNSLHGKISVGFLLIQDFFAIVALILISSLSKVTGSNAIFELVSIMVKTTLAVGLVVFLSKAVLPFIVHKLSKSQETLYVFTLAWALGVAALLGSKEIGLSLEIGGFLAGLALANSVESFQIFTKIKSVRDFFIILFFVHLGLELNISNLESIIIPSIILSAFVLIGNPIIVMLIMKHLGYKKRTGFMAGLSVAQISEFSLIMAAAGANSGFIDASDNVLPVLTLVGITTFTISSYMILNSHRLYEIMEPKLKFFEFDTSDEEAFSVEKEIKNHIIIIGAHRIGRQILENLVDDRKKIVVVDFDPDNIDWAKENQFNYVFGDATDEDILEKAQVSTAKIVLSTIPSYEDNIILMSIVNKFNEKADMIVTATNDEYVDALKSAGADFVIQPYTFIGYTIGDLIKKNSIHEILEKLQRKRSY